MDTVLKIFGGYSFFIVKIMLLKHELTYDLDIKIHEIAHFTNYPPPPSPSQVSPSVATRSYCHHWLRPLPATHCVPLLHFQLLDLLLRIQQRHCTELLPSVLSLSL